MEEKPLIQADKINKHFRNGVSLHVLKDISFTLNKGEFASVIGKSGCGKSTLLYILSTMDTDYTGNLFIDGESMQGKSERALAAVRNSKIGFVFQFHYLLNEFSVVKNVMLPGYKLDKHNEAALRKQAIQYLEALGIAHLADKMANQLSGGEKQRVAIARALINDPLILMCDEPTGNLDNKNTEIVFDIFQTLVTEFKKTLLVVTHDMHFAERTSRIIQMDDGRIID